MGEPAMNNAVNICHNIQDFLFFRGYQWDKESEKTDKRRKRRRRKSQNITAYLISINFHV